MYPNNSVTYPNMRALAIGIALFFSNAFAYPVSLYSRKLPPSDTETFLKTLLLKHDHGIVGAQVPIGIVQG